MHTALVRGARSCARDVPSNPRCRHIRFSLPFSNAFPCTPSASRTSQNLEPTWLPHWPPWMCTISRMIA
eukprot:scaffold1401_cov330-Pavlova_lutheri.AAC.111